MAISPIEMNGMVTRSQDISTLKQNEDNKAMIHQGNIANTMVKKNQEKSEQVNVAEKTENNEYRYDAKEKGSGSYQSNNGRQKKKDDKESDGKVIMKQTGGFDMRV